MLQLLIFMYFVWSSLKAGLLSISSCGMKKQSNQTGDHYNSPRHSVSYFRMAVLSSESTITKSNCDLEFCFCPFRAMQELLIHFHPQPSVPPPTPSTLSSLTTTTGQSGKCFVFVGVFLGCI